MKMRRLTAYVAGSVMLATVVVTYAAVERPNFYSAAVYLSQSNACLMILCNLALVLAGSFMYGLQQLLFGPLRALEIEQLWEKGWFAMMEWVFAMSTFRDEFGVWFLVMFISLFTGKVWGWIAEGRVEHLEQQAQNDPRLFHGRLVASLAIYALFAVQMFLYSFDIVLYEARPGMTIMFVFEFAILCISAMATCLRYVIWVQEQRITRQQISQTLQARKEEIRKQRQEAEERQKANPNGTDELASLPREEDIDENEIEAPGWEAKRGWLFALDIISDLLKLVAYMAFFTILTVFYGIPIYIIRDLYMTMRSFTKRITDYLRFQAATRDMDTRYPNATAQDLEADNTCIVCREEMRPYEAPDAGGAAPPVAQAMHQRQKPKKLPCGHILHFGCLSSWLERQQACPICRRSVFTQVQAQPGHAVQLNGQAPAGRANNQGQNNQQRQQQNEGRIFRLGPIQLQFGGRIGRADDQEMVDILGRLAENRLRIQQNAQNAPGAAGRDAPGQEGEANPQESITTADSAGSSVLDPANSQIHPGIRSAAARMALNTIEEQIKREIQALNIQGQRAAALRATLNEVDRLRGVPQPPRQTRPVLTPGSLMPMTQGFGTAALPPFFRPEIYNQNPPVIPLGYTAQGAADSAHATRPPGLVLPQGWTLVPVNPIGDHANTTQSSQAPALHIPTQQLNPLAPTRTAGPANTPLANPFAQFLANSVSNGTPTGASVSNPGPSASQGPSLPLNGNGLASSSGPTAITNRTSDDASLESPVQHARTQPLVDAPSWSFPSSNSDAGQASGESQHSQSNSKGKALVVDPDPSTVPETHVEPPTPVVEDGARAKQPSVEEADDE